MNWQLAQGIDAEIIHESDLLDKLKSAPQGGLYTKPFRPTPDGQPELVIVSANLVRHFTIITQSCDVCGVDKKNVPGVAVILPICTLMEMCKYDPIPIGPKDSLTTIEDLLAEHDDRFNCLSECDNDLEYGILLRDELEKWQPPKGLPKETKGRIKNRINSLPSAAHFFTLPHSTDYCLPEAYVNFSQSFTVPIAKLLEMKHRRLCRIADPYRDSFAEKYANRYFRIATPKPMLPGKIK